MQTKNNNNVKGEEERRQAYLIGSGTEGETSEVGDLVCNLLVEALVRVESCSNSCSTLSQEEESWQSSLYPLKPIRNLYFCYSFVSFVFTSFFFFCCIFLLKNGKGEGVPAGHMH